MEAIELSNVNSRVSMVDGSRVEGFPVLALRDVGLDVGVKVGRAVVGTSSCGHTKLICVEFKRRYAFAIR